AGRAGRTTDALSVQKEKRGWRLDALEGETRCVWDSIGACAIRRRATNRFKQRFFKTIAHRANVAFRFCEILGGELGCFSKTNNRRDVFRSATACVFLAAARNQRIKLRLPIDVKRANTLWPVKFMSGKRKKIDRCIAQMHRDFSSRLHSVRMKQHAFLT